MAHSKVRPAGLEHPVGHEKELYFWSLIVAILIFRAGGGMSITASMLLQITGSINNCSNLLPGIS